MSSIRTFVTGLCVVVLLAAGVRAEAAAVALGGTVSSAEEGAMEGVLVSAQRAGSPITVTVVSDAQGRYAFPADRLAAGAYTLTIRAAGYELGSAATVDVAAERTAAADLKLRKTADLAAQLTSTEWLNSMPGTAEQKLPLIECMSCHTLERVLRSKFSADEFVGVLRRMQGYANNTTTQHPQRRVAARDLADYVASVNLSGGRETWAFPLKPLPRPRGRATRVIITEYALPRTTI